MGVQVEYTGYFICDECEATTRVGEKTHYEACVRQIENLGWRVDDGDVICGVCLEGEDDAPLRFDDLEEEDRFEFVNRDDGPFRKLEGRDYEWDGDGSPPSRYSFWGDTTAVVTCKMNPEVERVE